MSSINYWKLSKEELMKLLEEREIEIVEADKDNRKIICALLKQWDLENGQSDEMLVTNEDGEEEVIVRKPQEKYVMLNFHSVSEQEAPTHYMGHNGKRFLIPKNVDTVIPKFLLDSVIKEAIEFRTTPVTRSDGKIVYKVTPVKRFPHTFIKEMTDEEMEQMEKVRR